MSSHPGSTLKDAVYLAEYLYKNHMRPEQVQDFYPTPGTVSTCMFYTGLDPYTLKPVFVEKTPEGKALQRALLQYYEPRNAEKVVKACLLYTSPAQAASNKALLSKYRSVCGCSGVSFYTGQPLEDA